MNISLPTPLRDWVQKQVEAGNYGSSSEYVREMIRRLRNEQWREGVDEKLLAALSSPTVELTEDVWKQIRAQGGNAQAAQRHQRDLNNALS